ncbi:universal stress protein [Pontibacter harenae]|uniref:universal stress protein n=1 Tax=Pontibacter harenae TaxID=2894083 RepID=UPI001E449A6A|nr:universal stress protein [Pontibacter harenae]MCC9167555.1 universal stress protein [Pontibacter harenae]
MLRDFLKIFKAKLQVLHLYRTAEQFDAHNSLEVFYRNFQDIDYDFSFDLRKDVAAGIQDFVQEQQADLLVMIPQKHNFFARLLDLSITAKITTHPLVPLLALPSTILHQKERAKKEAAVAD